MLTVFIVTGGVGLALLVVSLLLGEMHGVALSMLDNDLFSSAVIGAFLAALGFVGALIEGSSGNTVLATGAGVAAGGTLGYAARSLTRALQHGGDNATVRAEALPGREGHVVEDIPAAGMGIVTIRVAGHLTRLHARCDRPLPAGTLIVVTSVLSPTAVTVRVAGPQDAAVP
jgi:membrane protein implicated in regulation of membrane protease activity